MAVARGLPRRSQPFDGTLGPCSLGWHGDNPPEPPFARRSLVRDSTGAVAATQNLRRWEPTGRYWAITGDGLGVERSREDDITALDALLLAA
jgi:hypothetical protein